MSAEGVAIEAHGLGKSYRLGLQMGNLRETVSGAVRHPVATLRRRRDVREADFLWALRDATLTINEGDVVGLIGHNGAGKSTLLKLLSRITEPSTGWAEVTGRTGSLLEVGTGFHPELTGRENIFLNGSILGMRRAEIRRRFDEIVEFAEVERFLDTPVKRYSSGMAVRLAFAVAAHLEPEILLVDEVLSVGDAWFQRRSLAKMSEVAKQGRTVIVVSHNLGIVRALCDRGILLERGQIVADAGVGEAVDVYLSRLERAASDDLLTRTDRDIRGFGETLVSRLYIHDPISGQDDVVVGGRRAKIVVEFTELIPPMSCSLTISNSLGEPVTQLDSEIPGADDVRDPSLGTRIECDIASLPLLPGRYRIDVALSGGERYQDGLQGAAYFDVEAGEVAGRPMTIEDAEGNVMLPYAWRIPA
ncbi:MAG TPA: ABC transporter ATP-binding protein [Solirubrobacterales bacterium]|nr:ABC transporter ATP-binding protein [Solirubrobacterales bacterium]